MSYCRWSSDNFKCDLYVYECVEGGFMTHVASNRYVGDIPPITADPSDSDEHSRQYESRYTYLRTCKPEKIGLLHDGEHFLDDTLDELLERIVYLKDTGYRVPDYVLARIKEEINETT